MFEIGRIIRAAFARRQSSGDAGEAQRLYAAGSAAIERGRYREAEALAAQARGLDPGSWQIALLHGLSLLELGRHQESVDALDFALKCDVGYPFNSMIELSLAVARARADIASSTQAATPQTGSCPESVSVIVCSNSPEKLRKVSESYASALLYVEHEIVAIRDARSLCEGYNRGIAMAQGRILVFSHDDIEIASVDFAAQLAKSLAAYDLVGVAGTTKVTGTTWWHSGWSHARGQICHREAGGRLGLSVLGPGFGLAGQIQALDGVFFACRREVVDELRFDEQTFDGWHFYDLDFTYSAWLAGVRSCVNYDIMLVHDSEGKYDDDWKRLERRFIDKHKGCFAAQASREAEEGRRFPIAHLGSVAEWRLVSRHLFSRRASESRSSGV